MRIATYLAVSLLHAITSQATACYNLAGTAPYDESFQPCDPNAAVSACCATNKAQGDICMQGGLCYATMGSYSGYLYGNGCTDHTGNDKACPHVCPVVKGWKSYNVLPCSLDTWCCRESSDLTNCCDNTTMLIKSPETSILGRFINNTIPGTASQTSSNANSTTTTTTTTTTVTATPSASASAVSPSATVVGAAVGAALGIALLIALTFLFLTMKKMSNLKKEMHTLKEESHSSSAFGNTSAGMSSQHPYHPVASTYEADWGNARHEIDSIAK